MIRTLAATLPQMWQCELKRWMYWRQIKRGTWASPEPEFAALAQYITPGATVIDVGANIGHYTREFSRLVGATGRVYALEPIPQTFEMLAGNMRGVRNVTLMNAAASSVGGLIGMDVPTWGDSDLQNLYRASVTANGAYQVLAITLDALPIDDVRLIKMDAEGHELSVLKGGRELIHRCKPVIIIETPDAETSAWLRDVGYTLTHAAGSPNVVARVN